MHFNEVFLANHGLGDKAQILGHGIAKGLAHQLARVLYGKGQAEVAVPVRVDGQLALANPARVPRDDALQSKRWRNAKFFQSGPDCVKFVASFSVEPD
ncbi:hypothetical protein JCM16814_24070 [Desulfobaculum senezii]